MNQKLSHLSMYFLLLPSKYLSCMLNLISTLSIESRFMKIKIKRKLCRWAIKKVRRAINHKQQLKEIKVTTDKVVEVCLQSRSLSLFWCGNVFVVHDEEARPTTFFWFFFVAQSLLRRFFCSQALITKINDTFW